MEANYNVTVSNAKTWVHALDFHEPNLKHSEMALVLYPSQVFDSWLWPLLSEKFQGKHKFSSQKSTTALTPLCHTKRRFMLNNE